MGKLEFSLSRAKEFVFRKLYLSLGERTEKQIARAFSLMSFSRMACGGSVWIYWELKNLSRNLPYAENVSLYGDPLREIPGGFTIVEKEMGSRLVRVRKIRILLPIATGEFETSIGPKTNS